MLKGYLLFLVLHSRLFFLDSARPSLNHVNSEAVYNAVPRLQQRSKFYKSWISGIYVFFSKIFIFPCETGAKKYIKFCRWRSGNMSFVPSDLTLKKEQYYMFRIYSILNYENY
jgi:hypothetical protein